LHPGVANRRSPKSRNSSLVSIQSRWADALGKCGRRIIDHLAIHLDLDILVSLHLNNWVRARRVIDPQRVIGLVRLVHDRRIPWQLVDFRSVLAASTSHSYLLMKPILYTLLSQSIGEE
jgi:hypothetical protein